MFRMCHALFILLVVSILATGTAAAKTLDDGLLDPEWFGADLAWHRTDDIDYIWVADGFGLDDKTLLIADWQDPEFLHKKDRDAKDSARAYELSERMPGLLRGAVVASMDSSTAVTDEEGDLILIGRFVDVNAGSRVAKWMVGFGAGSATATMDLKIVDAESGEVVAAIHHRSVSGTHMSDIDDKIVKWLDEDLGKALRTGLRQTYASGKPARK